MRHKASKGAKGRQTTLAAVEEPVFAARPPRPLLTAASIRPGLCAPHAPATARSRPVARRKQGGSGAEARRHPPPQAAAGSAVFWHFRMPPLSAGAPWAFVITRRLRLWPRTERTEKKKKKKKDNKRQPGRADKLSSTRPGLTLATSYEDGCSCPAVFSCSFFALSFCSLFFCSSVVLLCFFSPLISFLKETEPGIVISSALPKEYDSCC